MKANTIQMLSPVWSHLTEMQPVDADGIYFYDGHGNVAEFIVRYDLENMSNIEGFNKEMILSLQGRYPSSPSFFIINMLL